MTVPVIDLFAGPGGLGEGFCQIDWGKGANFFRIGLSVEKDPAAHRTLKLRSFFRQFPYGGAPKEYYEYLKEGRAPEELYKIKDYLNQAKSAENEAWCAELGSGNHFDRLLDEKISKIITRNRYWVLIGGPPCQAYSLVGRVRNKGVKNYDPENDLRHFLYLEYLRIIAKHEPAIFVMENVKGILSSKVNGDRIFEEIERDLKNPSASFYGNNGSGVKYRIFSLVNKPKKFDSQGAPIFKKEDFIIESEKYGIPQARHRVILLGIREDLCRGNLTPPVLEEQENFVRTKKVLGLPPLRSGISRGKYDESDWVNAVQNFPVESLEKEICQIAGMEVLNVIKTSLKTIVRPQQGIGAEFVPRIPWKMPRYLEKWYIDHRLEGIFNHSSRTHMIPDLHRYLYASSFAKIHKVSPRMHQFPEALKPDHKNKDSGDFNDRFRVQLPHLPSCTITSHISKDGHYYIHYDPRQCRSLTVREAARLQTFPDNYFFCGNRTEQYIQVGNAVPPLLAYKIAEIVKEFLLEAIQVVENEKETSFGKEILLSVA